MEENNIGLYNKFLQMFKGILLNIFSITDADYSHKLIRIFWIKIRILKSENKNGY